MFMQTSPDLGKKPVDDKPSREYVKAHPGIIAEMDIEKARWEK